MSWPHLHECELRQANLWNQERCRSAVPSSIRSACMPPSGATWSRSRRWSRCANPDASRRPGSSLGHHRGRERLTRSSAVMGRGSTDPAVPSVRDGRNVMPMDSFDTLQKARSACSQSWVRTGRIRRPCRGAVFVVLVALTRVVRCTKVDKTLRRCTWVGRRPQLRGLHDVRRRGGLPIKLAET